MKGWKIAIEELKEEMREGLKEQERYINKRRIGRGEKRV